MEEKKHPVFNQKVIFCGVAAYDTRPDGRKGAQTETFLAVGDKK